MPEKEIVVAVVVACCRGLVSGLGLRISVLIGPTSSMAAHLVDASNAPRVYQAATTSTTTYSSKFSIRSPI